MGPEKRDEYLTKSALVLATIAFFVFLNVELEGGKGNVIGALIMSIFVFFVWIAVAGSVINIFIFTMPPKYIPPKSDKNSRQEAAIKVDDYAFGYSQTPTEFENEIAKLIEYLGETRTQVIGGSGDGGIDIEIYSERGNVIGVVQCKFYKSSKTIPPLHIRALNSARHYAHANYAYLVTTGRFSDRTHQEAQDLGVTLIDGERLDRIRMKLENPFSELVH